MVHCTSISMSLTLSLICSHRLLVVGGTFFLISLGSPVARLDVFSKAGLNWDVEVILMPKPIMYLKSEASLSGESTAMWFMAYAPLFCVNCKHASIC